MFLGVYQHSLDAKGRVILPRRFRDELADGGVMSKGLDGCLTVFTNEEFSRIAGGLRDEERTGAKARQAARMIFSGATEVQPDAQGRVPIPLLLREYAQLGRDVSIVGVYTRVEIWDAQQWRTRESDGSRELYEGGEELKGFV